MQARLRAMLLSSAVGLLRGRRVSFSHVSDFQCGTSTECMSSGPRVPHQLGTPYTEAKCDTLSFNVACILRLPLSSCSRLHSEVWCPINVANAGIRAVYHGALHLISKGLHPVPAEMHQKCTTCCGQCSASTGLIWCLLLLLLHGPTRPRQV